MQLAIERVEAKDTAECGRICYEAFAAIAKAHNFPPDFPDVEVAKGMLAMLAASQGHFGLVAKEGGRIVGSNFLDERDAVSGVGPITVDPAVQNDGVGRALMEAVMERSAQRGFAGIRLVQSGYHCRSLALYAKLGFEVRGHLACLQGPAIGGRLEGYAVRPAREADIAACNALCLRVHGHHRGGALAGAVRQGSATVVERAGRLTGYATALAFFGHAVGETNEDVEALIAAAPAFGGPGIRMTQPLTLMSMGLYNEPAGAWLPSILY
jgi:GNAT superfamily N-acetyltransferase